MRQTARVARGCDARIGLEPSVAPEVHHGDAEALERGRHQAAPVAVRGIRLGAQDDGAPLARELDPALDTGDGVGGLCAALGVELRVRGVEVRALEAPA